MDAGGARETRGPGTRVAGEVSGVARHGGRFPPPDEVSRHPAAVGHGSLVPPHAVLGAARLRAGRESRLSGGRGPWGFTVVFVIAAGCVFGPTTRPNPKATALGGQGFSGHEGGARDGIHAPPAGTPESSLVSSTVCRHSEETAPRDPEEPLQLTATRPPRLRVTSVCCLPLALSLVFVTASWMG